MREVFESSSTPSNGPYENALPISTPSTFESQSRSATKGIQKANLDPKGKGKAISQSLDAKLDEDEDDEAYVTSYDYGTPQKPSHTNGQGLGNTCKGKGKGVAKHEFGVDEDDDLYI